MKRKTAKERMHNYFEVGGIAGNTIEVEDDEIIETPDGQVGQVQGATHAEGGVSMNVPPGTKIFSDRVKVEGKTMQERKMDREKIAARLARLLKRDPSNKLLQNTIKRTAEVQAAQEADDMAYQMALREPEAPEGVESFATGGIVGGGPGYPGGSLDDLMNQTILFNNLYSGGIYDKDTNIATRLPKTAVPMTPGVATVGRSTGTPTAITAPKVPKGNSLEALDGVTAGDWVGMAGTALGALMPLLNTNQAAAANKPNVNRWMGYGSDALQTNATQENVASTLKDSAQRDIDTATNTAMARNRNSASSVNTLRAMDTVTDMASNKASVQAADAFSGQLLGILDKRSAIQMESDKMQRYGEQQRDTEDKADSDNFFSNRAQNYAGIGEALMSLGQGFNTKTANNQDVNLLSQLSKYGLTFDKKGNIVNGE